MITEKEREFARENYPLEEIDHLKIESVDQLKPGWVVVDPETTECFVYTGGGHYDFIDTCANNGWDTKWVFNERRKLGVYLLEEDKLWYYPMDRDNFHYAVAASYHTIMAGAGYKNPTAWWNLERWGGPKIER